VTSDDILPKGADEAFDTLSSLNHHALKLPMRGGVMVTRPNQGTWRGRCTNGARRFALGPLVAELSVAVDVGLS
jgi:hypothetical protein